jgi:hypothetical protein
MASWNRAVPLEHAQHAFLLRGLAADGHEHAAAAQVHRGERMRKVTAAESKSGRFTTR